MTNAELTALQEALDTAISATDAPLSATGLFRATARRSAAQQLQTMRATSVGARLTMLHSIHPALESLVGSEFFEHAAGRYCRQAPGTTTDLREYGQGFGTWLSALPLDDIPWAADLARLEWAIYRATNAPVLSRLSADALAQIPPEQQGQACFVLDPRSALVQSDYAVDGLWHAYAKGRLDGFNVDGPCWVLVRPGQICPTTTRLDAAAAAAWQAFEEAPNLEAVCMRLSDAGHDPSALLVQGMGSHWFSNVRVKSVQGETAQVDASRETDR